MYSSTPINRTSDQFLSARRSKTQFSRYQQYCCHHTQYPFYLLRFGTEQREFLDHNILMNRNISLLFVSLLRLLIIIVTATLLSLCPNCIQVNVSLRSQFSPPVCIYIQTKYESDCSIENSPLIFITVLNIQPLVYE